MCITRKFLGWSQPALPTTVDYLLSRYVRDGVFDLDNVALVVPGGRAGRRLLESLVLRAEALNLLLYPPRVETMGSLPELLYQSKRPMASPMVQQLAWIRALQSRGRQRAARFIRVLPESDDVLRWLAIGELLRRQHRELAADGMHFGDVVRVGERAHGFQEKSRWSFLREVQLRYLGILDELELWDRQTARLFAIEHQECHTEHEIILIGTSDMNQATRRMIDQVQQQVAALVFAPPEYAHAFDSHGCVEPEVSRNLPLAVRTEQVAVVDGPAEQAAEAARIIAAYEGQRRADEISIGILDDRIVPQLQRQLLQCRAGRWVVGRRVPETLVYRLFEVVADYLEQGRFAALSSLARHADVSSWLARRGVDGDWITRLDQYHQEHLPPAPGRWLGEEGEWHSLDALHAEIERLVKPLRGGARKLGEWTEPLLRLLLEVYRGVRIDRDSEEGHYLREATRCVQNVLLEQEAIPPQLSPNATACQAIHLLLEQLAAREIPPLPDDEAIELLGWLELPLDSASALIVTSFNDRFVPKSQNSDLFLPNALRKRLGLLDNSRRYARDAYALSTLLASRAELRLIVARRDGEGDPLRPSRLLFAAEQELVAQRALAFFSETSPAAPGIAGELSGRRSQSEFYVSPPPLLETPPTAFPVTAFRAYLACPYRFYLRYVLRLKPQHDQAAEMDAAMFGTLMHDVLKIFGRCEMRDSTSPEVIGRALRQALDQCAAERFGDNRLASVSVQLRQARSRLEAFAHWQSQWAAQGWRIRHIEAPEDYLPIEIKSAQGAIQVHGRIDRIDYHEQRQQWMIFDYKTSDRLRTPQQTHLRGENWVDLQLPLYRRLASRLSVPKTAKLGYIVLPKDTQKVGCQIAPWGDDQLAAADRRIEYVAERILSQVFWPPTDPPPEVLTEFASICQDASFEKRYSPAPPEATP